MPAEVKCCVHPVERHAYNGCANCGCSVRWDQHPDRDQDRSESAWDVLRAKLERAERVAETAVAWQKWFIVGQEEGLRKARNPNGELVRAVDDYLCGKES